MEFKDLSGVVLTLLHSGLIKSIKIGFLHNFVGLIFLLPVIFLILSIVLMIYKQSILRIIILLMSIFLYYLNLHISFMAIMGI